MSTVTIQFDWIPLTEDNLPTFIDSNGSIEWTSTYIFSDGEKLWEGWIKRYVRESGEYDTFEKGDIVYEALGNIDLHPTHYAIRDNVLPK